MREKERRIMKGREENVKGSRPRWFNCHQPPGMPRHGWFGCWLADDSQGAIFTCEPGEGGEFRVIQQTLLPYYSLHAMWGLITKPCHERHEM
jgi:hypothetical protein